MVKDRFVWLLGGCLLAVASTFLGFIFNKTYSNAFVGFQLILIAIALLAGIVLIKQYHNKNLGSLFISFAVTGILIWIYLIYLLYYIINNVFDKT